MDMNQVLRTLHVKTYDLSYLSIFGLAIHAGWRITSILPQEDVVYKPRYLTITQSLLESLLKKEKLYRNGAQYHRSDFGFVHTDKCDSLLLTSLVGVRKDFPITIDSVIDHRGYLHRRPLTLPQCYPQHSKSSISRDMLVGYAFYCLFKRESYRAKQFLYSAKENAYVMGIGDPSRIIMMPTLEKLFYLIAKKEIRSMDKTIASRMYTPMPLNLKGYQVKLLLLTIMMLGHLNGGLTAREFKVLEHYKNTIPKCPLADILWAIYAPSSMPRNIDKEVAILSSPIFPDDRLPCSRDRSIDWYWDAQNPKDLSPDVELVQHPGCDFLFYMWLLKYALKIEE